MHMSYLTSKELRAMRVEAPQPVKDQINAILNSRMSYNIDGRQYYGFRRLMKPDDANDGAVVMAWFDGEPDLWVVNLDDGGLEELRESYAADWGPTRVTFTVFAKQDVGV